MNPTELGGIVDAVVAGIAKMQQWPAAVLIIAALIVSGGVMKAIGAFPNRFIPICVIALGSVLNFVLGDFGAVAPEQRNPGVILGLQGVLLGFAAWSLHALLLRRFEKYLPFLSGKADAEPEENEKTNQPKQ